MAPKTLDCIATDLKNFREWCNSEGVDYLNITRKVKRPTYMYRGYLQGLLNDGKISAQTVKRRIGSVIGFYKYLIESEGIRFKFPLWENNLSLITYKDREGFNQAKQVNTTDIGKIPSSSNPDLFDDAIVDGGRLHPLSQEEQIQLVKALYQIANTEMTLGFLISLTTGARIQTVYTLRLKHFERVLSSNEDTVIIKVGLGTHCDTKFEKQHTILLPRWIYNKVRIYLNSPRALSRRNKAKHIFDREELQYVFLNNRGVPFYAAQDDKYRKLYRESPNGNAIRQFIHSSLKKELKKAGNDFNFSFHDLRATFGMNLFNRLMPLVQNEEINLTRLLLEIKERMGHSSFTTTERYLNYKNRHKIKQMAQDDFEKHLYEISKKDI